MLKYSQLGYHWQQHVILVPDVLLQIPHLPLKEGIPYVHLLQVPLQISPPHSLNPTLRPQIHLKCSRTGYFLQVERHGCQELGVDGQVVGTQREDMGEIDFGLQGSYGFADNVPADVFVVKIFFRCWRSGFCDSWNSPWDAWGRQVVDLYTWVNKLMLPRDLHRVLSREKWRISQHETALVISDFVILQIHHDVDLQIQGHPFSHRTPKGFTTGVPSQEPLTLEAPLMIQGVGTGVADLFHS